MNQLIEKIGGFAAIKLMGGYNSALPITTTGKISGGSAVITGSLSAGAITGSDSVLSVTTATLAVTAAQSGTVFLCNRAAGIVFTLPAPVVGLKYRFVVATANTGTLKVITDAGTTFLQGLITSATTTASVFQGNGSSNISVLMNGTTTGGLLGTDLIFECISPTVWQVNGVNFTSGTTATAFSNT